MLAVAADVMQPEAKVAVTDHLGTAMELTQSTGLRQVPVAGTDGRLIGVLDESDVTRAYLETAQELGRRSQAARRGPDHPARGARPLSGRPGPSAGGPTPQIESSRERPGSV